MRSFEDYRPLKMQLGINIFTYLLSIYEILYIFLVMNIFQITDLPKIVITELLKLCLPIMEKVCCLIG